MAAIPRNLGRGGAYLTPGHGSPSLLDLLDGIADDLAAIVANIAGLNITSADPTAITGADPTAIVAADPGAALADAIGAALGAFTDPPSAAEMIALAALVNELRVAMLAAQARVNELRTLDIDFKARFAEYRTLILDQKARFAEYRTLILELKTDLTAGGGVTLVTTKAAS